MKAGFFLPFDCSCRHLIGPLWEASVGTSAYSNFTEQLSNNNIFITVYHISNSNFMPGLHQRP